MDKLSSYSLKIIDIIFLTILYVTISITRSAIISRIVRKIIGPNKRNMESESTIRLLSEIYFNLIAITLASYLIANIISLVSTSMSVDVSFGIIFGFILFYYQNNLREKINYVIDNRIIGGK